MRVALKWLKFARSGREDLITPAEAIAYAQRRGIALVPLHAEQTAFTMLPPAPNRDPFDEMLLAQAAYLDARLLTRDVALLDHPIALSA